MGRQISQSPKDKTSGSQAKPGALDNKPSTYNMKDMINIELVHPIRIDGILLLAG